MRAQHFYLSLLLFMITTTLVFVPFFYTTGSGYHANISLNDDANWYMNFRRSKTTQAQDRDILYHHIGQSINYAKKADIIIIGHSMALFGFDWRMLDSFSERNHIQIYNMSSSGDSSGEFLLRIIKKEHLNPTIWIINADDHEMNFFSKFLSNSGKGEASDVISYSDWQAQKNVLIKNIKWKIEIFMRKHFPASIIKYFYPQHPIYNYRSIVNGNWNNDTWPEYNDTHEPFNNVREKNCHANKQDLSEASEFIDRLHGKSVILTLIPHMHSCRQRVREIADFTNKTFISIDWQGMTSFDEGGHLDRNGAEKFTASFLNKLEKTPEFKRLLANHKHSL